VDEPIDPAQGAGTEVRGRRAPERQEPLASAAMEAPPSNDSIAQRAYELFVERGGDHGRDVEDWLRAERDLSAATAKPAR
jgi:hypothetical protein